MIRRFFIHKCIFFVVLIQAFCPVQASGQKLTPEAYIDKFSAEAVRQMNNSGIPASITLAQGALESGWGGSELAVNASNHFGIKCHGWRGQGYRKKTGDDHDCFRKYADPEESYRDHTEFLKGRDRYSSLFSLAQGDYKGWAYGLQAAGYSTNPKYASLLIAMIEKYSLYRFDERSVYRTEEMPVVSTPPVPRDGGLPVVKNSSIYYKYSQGHTLYETNGVTYLFASEGDTYESIAGEYELFTKEILCYNDLKRYDGPVPAGTKVYIQRKKKSSRSIGSHPAERGDTYYDLSQRYGVRLSCIYKYNGVKEGDVPAEGEEIFLRKPKKTR